MSTIVFDVNETLSDMRPLADRFEGLGAPRELAATWFAATLRDGFALAVHGTSRPFADVARDVLAGLVTPLGIDAQAAADDVLAGFQALSLHPDVAPGVEALVAGGHRLVTLSNGAASVAEGLLERAGLRERFARILTVEDAGVWKPHPGAYRHAARVCDQPPGELVLVAVHPWDLDGAHRAGLRTAFLDRTGAPWPATFAEPDLHVGALLELAHQLEHDA